MTLRLIVLASALARFPASRHPRPDLPHTTASGNAGSESIATLGPIANWHVLDANGTAGSRRRTVLFSQILSAIDNFMYSPVVDTLKRPDSATGERDGAGSFSSALLSGGVKDTYIKGDTTMSDGRVTMRADRRIVLFGAIGRHNFGDLLMAEVHARGTAQQYRSVAAHLCGLARGGHDERGWPPGRGGGLPIRG